jgi:hypothetical protein
MTLALQATVVSKHSFLSSTTVATAAAAAAASKQASKQKQKQESRDPITEFRQKSGYRQQIKLKTFKIPFTF